MTEYGNYDPDDSSYLMVHEWLILQRELNLDTLKSTLTIQLPLEDFFILYAIKIGMYPLIFQTCIEHLEAYEGAIELIFSNKDSTFLEYIIIYD